MPLAMEGTKICAMCFAELPVDCFSFDGGKGPRFRRGSYCRTCRAQRMRGYRTTRQGWLRHEITKVRCLFARTPPPTTTRAIAGRTRREARLARLVAELAQLENTMVVNR